MKSEIEYFFLEDFKEKLELAKEIKAKGDAAIVEVVMENINSKILISENEEKCISVKKGEYILFTDYFGKKEFTFFRTIEFYMIDKNPSLLSILELLIEEKEMRTIRDMISASVDADTSLNPSFLERVIEKHQYE